MTGAMSLTSTQASARMKPMSRARAKAYLKALYANVPEARKK